MFNHARGLWGYTGWRRDGEPLIGPGDRHGRPERGDRHRGADRARRADARSGSGRAARSIVGFELGELVTADRGDARPTGEPRARRRRRRGRPTPALTAALEDGGGGRGVRVRLDGPLLRRAGRRAWTARARRRRDGGRGAAAGSRSCAGCGPACLLAVTDMLGRAERLDARRRRGARGDGARGLVGAARGADCGFEAAAASPPTRDPASLRTPTARSCARGGDSPPAPRPRAARRDRARSRRGARPSASSPGSGASGCRRPSDREPSSSRSTASSIPSRRCDTDRSRRVRRSMSAADGIFRAPPSRPPGPAPPSRAPRTRARARPSTTGLPHSSSAILPRASSPCGRCCRGGPRPARSSAMGGHRWRTWKGGPVRMADHVSYHSTRAYRLTRTRRPPN